MSTRAKPKSAARSKSAAGTKTDRLKRTLQPMPAFVRKALLDRGLMPIYRLRPAYQQNDYLGWINRAKLAATKEKRLSQMLDELDAGDVYMNMAWRPLKKPIAS